METRGDGAGVDTGGGGDCVVHTDVGGGDRYGGNYGAGALGVFCVGGGDWAPGISGVDDFLFTLFRFCCDCFSASCLHLLPLPGRTYRGARFTSGNVSCAT